MDTGFGGLHWIMLVMNRRGGAGQVVDFIHLHIKGKSNIVANQLEVGSPKQMQDILFSGRIKIISADNIMPIIQELFTKVEVQKREKGCL